MCQKLSVRLVFFSCVLQNDVEFSSVLCTFLSEIKGSVMKNAVKLLCTALLLLSTFNALAGGKTWAGNHSAATVDDFLSDLQGTFAIGHRGFGSNLGENPDKPIENTIAAVVAAYESGVSIVEVDVSITADGKAVVMHDDYLADLTCVNALSYEELRTVRPEIPTLRALLKTAKPYARKYKGSHRQAKRQFKKTGGKLKGSDLAQGLVMIEIKTPSPLCDATDSTENALTHAVIKAVRQSRTHKQVIIESFSPAILNKIANVAPEIPLNLTMTALQFLSEAQIEAATGLPVVLIDKDAGYSLQWAETGPFYRLPGYESVEQYLVTAYFAGVSLIALDWAFLAQADQLQPGAAAALVAQAKQLGFVVTGYVADTEQQWQMFEMWGVEGIFTSNVPLGAALQTR